MSDGQKNPKLIVVVAFDRGEDGELFAGFGPADQQSEDRAVRTAKGLAAKHVGVIAWSRDADPVVRQRRCARHGIAVARHRLGATSFPPGRRLPKSS